MKQIYCSLKTILHNIVLDNSFSEDDAKRILSEILNELKKYFAKENKYGQNADNESDARR